MVELAHVGNAHGPPDFVGRYDGEYIVVEVTRVLPSEGWGLTKEQAFAARLRTLAAQVYREAPNGPRWHIQCEYDPAQPCPPPRSANWQAEARRALSAPGPGGSFQLVPPDRQQGYGLELHLTPMPPSGAFGHLPEHDPALVASALGSAPLEELLSALPCVIAQKTSDLHSRSRYRSCDRWWLILDDDILLAPASFLTVPERDRVCRCVTECSDIASWSKVVLYNRRQPTPPPDPAPGWFWAIWECPAHAPLPASP
ncbi:MAG: hypothetical protein OXU81_00515 [Gammaproteobacteria bacterium]|nr:hypothetical protein [Gammaproteobacteria bacterium]